MKKILNIIIYLLILAICVFIIFKYKNVFINIKNTIIKPKYNENLVSNDYKKSTNYDFVSINPNYTIKNKTDIKNAIYTYLDAGWDKYTIVCDKKYTNCINDVKQIIEDNSYLTDISNFVHPYNTFAKFNTGIRKDGVITLEKVKRYTKEEIDKINEKVDKIYNENYDRTKNTKENIKIFHDYIINHTKYDTSFKKDQLDYLSESSTAYGVLFNGKGICTGYTETMQLFLEKLNVKNYRVVSPTHAWNLVYIEGKWKHLDLTWDDPLMSDGTNMLTDKYFLIDTNTLLSYKDGEHDFDSKTYKEANN